MLAFVYYYILSILNLKIKLQEMNSQYDAEQGEWISRPIAREEYHLLFTPSSKKSKRWGQFEQNSGCSSSGNSSYNSSQFSQNQFPTPIPPPSFAKTSTVKVKRRRLQKQQPEQSQCSICLQQIKQKSILPCSHAYCFQCLSQWFKTSTRCPYCRLQVPYFTCNGIKHTVEPKQFKYEPQTAEVLDWLCYRCNHTEQGDIILICDGCQAFACHIQCDQILNGVEPEGEWLCHYCR